MTAPPQRFSLWRWSRRKLESKAAATPPAVAAAPIAPAVSPATVELPPVESLTFESDFTAFLRPEVDERLKRAALKQLLRDPRFNVMDGLDVYIDDYTQADPVAPDVLADLLQRGFGGAQSAAAMGSVSNPEPAPGERPAASVTDAPAGRRTAEALPGERGGEGPPLKPTDA